MGKIHGLEAKKRNSEVFAYFQAYCSYKLECAALDRLNCSNITSQYLYLFGNIAYSKSEFKCYDNFIKVAIFGTLYEKFPYDILLKNLHDISHIQKKKLQIRIIGRQREEKGLSLLKTLAKKSNLLIFESGVLSTDSISHELQICDLGVCTTPLDIIGKSGATAAMLEHGLPVIAFDDGDTPIDKLFVFKEFKKKNLRRREREELLKTVTSKPHVNSLAQVMQLSLVT